MKARTSSLKRFCKTNKPPENLLGQSWPPEQAGVGRRGRAGPRRKVPFVPAFLTSPSRASSLGELKYWGRCCLEVSPDAETRGGDAGPSRGNEQPGQRGGPAGCRGGQLSRQSPRESTPPWGLCQTCTTPTPTPTRQPGRSSRPRSQDEESLPARPQRPPHPGGDGVRGWGGPSPHTARATCETALAPSWEALEGRALEPRPRATAPLATGGRLGSSGR